MTNVSNDTYFLTKWNIPTSFICFEDGETKILRKDSPISDLGRWRIKKNVFGIYQNKTGNWTAYVTDGKMGHKMKSLDTFSEETAIAGLRHLIQKNQYQSMEKHLQNKFGSGREVIGQRLEKSHCSKGFIHEVLQVTDWNKEFRNELLYFIEEGKFIEGDFQMQIDGFTAKSIYMRTGMDGVSSICLMLFSKYNSEIAKCIRKNGGIHRL